MTKKNESFKKSDRVLKRGTFLSAIGSKHVNKSRHFIVVELRDRVGEKRIGITVSKRVGGAVKRNRVKRLIREFFRKSKDRIRDDTYYIVIARKNSHTLTYGNVFDELSRLMFHK